jgi:hypothetical protein
MDQSEKKLRGIQFRKFTELPECQIRRCIYRFYICVWHYGSSRAGHTGSSFYVPEVHYIYTRHFGCLICTSGVPCYSSISPLFLFQWKQRKILNHLASISLIKFSKSKDLNSYTYLVTLSL